MIDSKTAQELRDLVARTTGEEFKMMVLDMLGKGDTEEISTPKSKEDIAKKICDIFRELGIPSHIRGYNYLLKAIIYCIDKGNDRCFMTKEVYPAVAREFDSTPTRVERAIRNAIETWYDRSGTCKGFEKYFGNAYNPNKGKPTNAEFIYAMVTWIQYNM